MEIHLSCGVLYICHRFSGMILSLEDEMAGVLQDIKAAVDVS